METIKNKKYWCINCCAYTRPRFFDGDGHDLYCFHCWVELDRYKYIITYFRQAFPDHVFKERREHVRYKL